MSCNNAKCQAWLCILRSRALRALDSSSHHSSSSASFCNQRSFLASPSSTLQDRFNNSESSVARDWSTERALDYSVRHDRCSTTQSLKEQLGVDTSESFAWTSALETPAKSVQPQGPSLQDQNLGSSFCELPRDASSKEKPRSVTLNNQRCRDPCEMQHHAARYSEHQCDSVLPEQAHNFSTRRVRQVSAKPDEENSLSQVECQRLSLNGSKISVMTNSSASTGEMNGNLSHDEEADVQLTSAGRVTKDLYNSCSYILDSVSPKLRRRSRNNTFNAKSLARSLFKHEPEAPPNCTRPAMDPAIEEPGAGVAHRRDQTGCVDVANSTDELAGKPSSPCKDGYNSESNEPSKEEKEIGIPIDSLVKESDEGAGKFYDLKKSPTITSRTPLNRLRKLPFKTSTPLLGSALFSAVRSQREENLNNVQKITEMSAGRHSETPPAITDGDGKEGIVSEIENKTVSGVSQRDHLTKTEVQTSVIDLNVLSTTEGNINPIDLLCSPVKKLKHIDSPEIPVGAGAEGTCHRSSLEVVTSSPFPSSKNCTVADHCEERTISHLCETTGKSSESLYSISKNEGETSLPPLLHEGDANVASISSVEKSKNEFKKCSEALPSIGSNSMAKKVPIQSLDIKSENDKTSALSAQTTSNLKPLISANGSTQSTSCNALPNSGITPPVTNSVCLVLETSENSHETAPSSENCITPTNIPLPDPNVGNTSCSSMSSATHSPSSTPVTHRKPRRLSLSARGAQKLEMLKKKINPSSSFIYPSSILERSHRVSTLKHSESIRTEISSCGFIDADVTASVPPVGTTSMKRDHRAAATSSPLLADHELVPKASSVQGNTKVQIEDCTKQALTSTDEFTTPTSSFRAGGYKPIDSTSSRINIPCNYSSNNHDPNLDLRKSSGLSEFHRLTDRAKNIEGQNYMNSEELAEVDDILQNCDFDFDDTTQISGEKKTDYNSCNTLQRTKDATSSAKNTTVLQSSHTVGHGKPSSSRPAIGCSFAFQTGRGATVQVSKAAVARAATLWKEASNSEASVLSGCNSEADQFTVPNVGKKFVHENNFDSGLKTGVRSENNSCIVDNEAVVPEVDAKKVEILSASERPPSNVEASTSMEDSGGASKGFGGFKTAAGNDVKVNEEAMKKAMRLWSECGDLKTVKTEGVSSFPGFSTAGGTKLETNSLALADAKLRLNNFKVSVEAIPKDSCDANGVNSYVKEDGFVTASGKPVKTSADAIEKAKRIWNDCDLSGSMSTAIDPKSASGGFSSAKGSRLPLSHDSLLKARRLWNECAQADTLDDNFAATSELKFDGFKTASGAQVCVSEKALRTAKNVLNSIEEADSEHILSKPKITDKFTSNPVSKTPTARPSKKGFIKHKIVHKNMSGLSSGLPEPDTYYSKIRSDLSRRIYPTNTSPKKSSSKAAPNDASVCRTTVNLSAEEKAILDSQFQDITEEFLNDDWNMEPEVCGKPPKDRSDNSRNLGTEKCESLVLQGEKRKISFENEKNSKRGKTATSAEDLDTEYAIASVPHLPDDAPVMSSSPKSPAPVDVQCPRSCNGEAKSSRRDGFDTECLSLHDGKAPTTNTADSVGSVSTFAGKIMSNCLNDSPTITNADRLRESRMKLSSFEGAPQLLVSEKAPLDPISCHVEIEGRNIANTSSKNVNSASPSNGFSANSPVNSETIISPPISLGIKLNLNSVCDSKTSVETSVVKPLETTDPVNNSTLTFLSNFDSGSALKPSTDETICSANGPSDGPNCARPDASPVIVRSRQIKKKIRYLRDVYDAPKSLSPLPSSPAVLRMPFRAPFKKKLSVDK